MAQGTRRLGIGVAVLALGFVGGSWAAAQNVYRAAQTPQLVAVKPLVVSGADIGFRIEARRGSTPIGKLVIRMDGGAWEDIEFPTADVARSTNAR